jgi:hypothetical protein
MSTEAKVSIAIDRAIDRLNELLPAGQAVSRDPGTILLGRSGRLDSMAFVNFIVALDEEIENQLGMKASMADELGESGMGDLTIQEVHSVAVRLADRAHPDHD